MLLKSPKNKSINILVVCLGNTCRSPAGEYLLRHYSKNSASQHISQGNFESAGIHPVSYGMANYTKDYLEMQGIEPNHFQNQQIPYDPLDDFDYILVMEEYMKEDILSRYYSHLKINDPKKYKEKEEKIILYSQAAGEDGNIEDPYSMSREKYFQILSQIDNYAKLIIARLNSN